MNGLGQSPGIGSGQAKRDGAGVDLRASVGVWSLFLLLWLLVVLAFAGQLVVSASIDWRPALTLSIRDWLPWALLTPVVAWLSFRFPFERDRLWLSLPVHLAASLAALLACQIISEPLPQPQPPFGIPEHQRLPGAPPPRFRPDGPMPGDPERAIDSPRFPPERRQAARHLFAPEFIARRAQFNIPVYWIVVSVAHALRYYRRSKEREQQARQLESSLAEARLEALQMQLHPHFLFNTLNAISTLVHKNPSAADEMIVNLGELLRAALETSRRHEVPLREELELLSRYLEIQQARFGDRLRVNREIDPAVLDVPVPTLILQPLAENAVRHGIEPRAASGTISVRAFAQGDQLCIRIANDGVPGGTSAPDGEGIGLGNTRARLRALYGDRARLDAGPSPEGGFSVEISFPIRRAPAGPATGGGG